MTPLRSDPRFQNLRRRFLLGLSSSFQPLIMLAVAIAAQNPKTPLIFLKIRKCSLDQVPNEHWISWDWENLGEESHPLRQYSSAAPTLRNLYLLRHQLLNYNKRKQADPLAQCWGREMSRKSSDTVTEIVKTSSQE